MSHTSRIVVLVDMDCFYCQVEEKTNPKLKGKPVAVVQYNEWRGGGIIAVNYEARAKGVTRHMRGNDAKQICPDINLVKVPQIRGKADLNKYREAGKQVADVLQTFTPILERASVDEAYLDISEAVEKRIQDKNYKLSSKRLENTFVVGSETQEFVDSCVEGSESIFEKSNYRLAIGGIITEEIRAEVYRVTGYRCSAGVAHNKILAKLVCGLHKPNKQTILPQDAVSLLYEDLPVKKIKGFGGKFGEQISEILNIRNMGELSTFSEKELASHFDEKAANWLYNIGRGIDHEPVTVRLISKSIGCSKNFLGRNALVSQESVEYWLKELVSELSERLEKDLEENSRKAKTMIIHFSHGAAFKNIVSVSRNFQISSYDQNKLIEKARGVLNKNCLKSDGTYNITHLGLSLGNFEDVRNVRSITSFFKDMENTIKDKQKTEVNDFSAKQKSSKINQNMKLDCTQTKVGKLSEDLSSFDQAKLLESSTFLESDTDSSDDDKSSIFSISTISDNKNDIENFIYLEHVRPESVVDQHFPDYENKNENKANFSSSSADSIGPEICKTRQMNLVDDRSSSSSFFEKYFSDEIVQRNFDTSKMLKENNIEDENLNNEDLTKKKENDEMEISGKSQEKLSIINDFFGNSPLKKYDSPSKTPVSGKEICLECGKSISLEEISSHMDYHFALKIVKSEAHLYKTPINNNVRKSPVKDNTKETRFTSKKIKRKSNETIDSMVPISKFFKKEENSQDATLEHSELCKECNIRMKIEDISSHFDYHAAKKLHLELNSQALKPKSPIKVKSLHRPKVDKKPKVVNSVVNIASYFKKC